MSKQAEMGYYESEVIKYPMWAKLLFAPFYLLWFLWLFILGAELSANLGGKKWLIK